MTIRRRKPAKTVMLHDVRGPIWWRVLGVTENHEDGATYCLLREDRDRRGKDDALTCWTWVPDEVLYKR